MPKPVGYSSFSLLLVLTMSHDHQLLDNDKLMHTEGNIILMLDYKKGRTNKTQTAKHQSEPTVKYAGYTRVILVYFRDFESLKYLVVLAFQNCEVLESYPSFSASSKLVISHKSL